MRQKLLIAGLVIAGLGMIAVGGSRYLSDQAAGDCALRFMTALNQSDVQTLTELSTDELGRQIQLRAVLDDWQPDAGIVHRVANAKSADGRAHVEVYSSKAGFRLQTTKLQLVEIDREWKVASGSFQIGDRWLKSLRKQQEQQAEQLFHDLKSAVEGEDDSR